MVTSNRSEGTMEHDQLIPTTLPDKYGSTITMGFDKNPPPDNEKHSESDEEKDKKDNLVAQRASLKQLYRYGNCFDITLVFIGATVSIVTGLGFPFLSIVIGNISQTFIVFENARNSGLNDTMLAEARDKFDHDVIQACIKYAVIGVVIMTSSLVQVTSFMVSCENVTNRMRKEFFKAIMRQDIPWFDENHSGTLATKLFDSMERVREGMGDKMGLMIQYVAQFFGGLVIALTYDWKLTLIMMSLSPVLVICGAFMAKLMASATAEEMKKYSVAGKIAEEVLTSIRTVISFNGQEQECKRYDAALEAGKLDGYKKSFYIGIGLAITMAMIFSSYCLAFWVGTDFIYHGKADPSKVLTVFFSVMMGSMALGQAGPQFATFGTALGAAGVVLQIIDREPEIDAYSKEGTKKKVVGRIAVKNLKFTYPTRKDVPILKGVSFTCDPGETVALVGASGCGKSTIIGLLLRYYNQESGSITIDETPIDEYNIEYLRQTVGVVSQEPILFNTTILENLRYGNADATDKDILHALKKANALNFINSFPQGLNTLVGDRGAQMSGGQKQRVAIARALLRNPRILLLDEATSALDAESESVVQEALENASQGRTTIVIAHRLSTIKNADKIVAMQAGQVVEIGTHDELLHKKGLYHELVNAQVFADVDEKKKGKEVKVLRRRISRRVSSMSQSSDLYDKIDDDDSIEIKEDEKDLERLKRELAEEGATEANLFKILQYAKPEWIFIALGTIACLIQGVVFPVFSLFFTQIMQVFAEVDKEKMRRDGHHWALMFLVLAGVQASTMILQATLYGISAERLTMRLRSKVFRNVLRQDGAYFDMPSHSAGKISTRLATDAPNIKAAIDYRLGSVFNAAIALTTGISIAFYYGWQMALLMLGALPIMGVGQAMRARIMKGRSDQDAKEMESSGKVAMEAVENIRTVQALTLQDTLLDKFCMYLKGPHDNSTKKAVLQGVTFAVANSIMFFIFAAEFRFGGWLVVSNHIPNPINVMRVMMAIQFSASSLGFASAYFPEYFKAKFAAGIIFKMLAEKPKIDNLTQHGRRPPIKGAVSFHDVHFTYPQRQEVPILKGLTFDVQPGETLALVGPSGCGKSTVVSLLERFYDPANGSVKVDNEDIREVNPLYMRSHIALVSQEPILFDTSIKENIVYGLPEGSVTDAEVVAAAKKANIHSFIASLPAGYDTSVGDKGTQLSGGQKQRVAIARALVRSPKILLLDEATSALDTESEKLVQEALDLASQGRTCIVIAHRLSTVINANCIMVVKNGEVIEKGTHQELMSKRGAYYELTLKQQVKTEADGEEPEYLNDKF